MLVPSSQVSLDCTNLEILSHGLPVILTVGPPIWGGVTSVHVSSRRVTQKVLFRVSGAWDALGCLVDLVCSGQGCPSRCGPQAGDFCVLALGHHLSH